ncbi:MAG TPA: hypothetical protein VIU64_07875 [Polyangia bacterium]
MSALLGLLMSYAALIGTAPAVTGAAAAEDVCGPAGTSACEPALDLGEEPVEYATPAEVNCPAPAIPTTARGHGAAAFDLPSSFEGCSPPVLDFHYRVSRSPESERPTGTLRPQRARRPPHPEAACTGLPPEHGTPLSASTLPPVAVYAVLALMPPTVHTPVTGSSARASFRVLEPLDRPPRA